MPKIVKISTLEIIVNKYYFLIPPDITYYALSVCKAIYMQGKEFPWVLFLILIPLGILITITIGNGYHKLYYGINN